MFRKNGSAMRSELISQLTDFKAFNSEEEKDRINIIRYLKESDDIFFRINTVCHMTASSWVVNKDRTKVLMCFHKIYNSWSWLGGHADGDEDLLNVALKEAKEESGLKNIVPVSKDIFSCEILTVEGHYKKGEYVSSHLHLNVSYLLEADENEVLVTKEDENKGLAWFTLDEALKASTEPWFVEHIYTKLNNRLRQCR